MSTITLHPTFGAHGEDEVAVRHADPACPFIGFGALLDGATDGTDCRFCVGGDDPRSLGTPSALDRYAPGGDTETYEGNYKRPGKPGASGPAKPYEERLAEVTDWLRTLGRKVEVMDITHGNKKVAKEWLRRYTGDSSFLCDVRDRGRGLTDGQAKGVLNCLRADVLYGERKAAAPAAPAPAGFDPLAILQGGAK